MSGRFRFLAFLLLIMLLPACNPTNFSSGGPGGTTTGTSTGLIGNLNPNPLKTTGTLTGTFLDTLASDGNVIDSSDRAAALRAEQRAYEAPEGQELSWSNPKNGSAGFISPTSDEYTADGDYCRQFQQTVVIRGRTQHDTGRACQQSDGNWKIVLQ